MTGCESVRRRKDVQIDKLLGSSSWLLKGIESDSFPGECRAGEYLQQIQGREGQGNRGLIEIGDGALSFQQHVFKVKECCICGTIQKHLNRLQMLCQNAKAKGQRPSQSV